MIAFVDVVNYLVKQTNTAVIGQLQAINPSIQELGYYYGHWADVTAALMADDKDANRRQKRIPGIFLNQDFDERHYPKLGVQREVRCRIIIAAHTRQEYLSKERYDNVIKPILYLIYDNFVEQVERSGLFALKNGRFAHTKTDRLYWGKVGGVGNTLNGFNDYLDCLDLQCDFELYDNICKQFNT